MKVALVIESHDFPSASNLDRTRKALSYAARALQEHRKVLKAVVKLAYKEADIDTKETFDSMLAFGALNAAKDGLRQSKKDLEAMNESIRLIRKLRKYA